MFLVPYELAKKRQRSLFAYPNLHGKKNVFIALQLDIIPDIH